VSKGVIAGPGVGQNVGVGDALPAPKVHVVPVADPGVVFVAAQTFPPWWAAVVFGTGYTGPVGAAAAAAGRTRASRRPVNGADARRCLAERDDSISGPPGFKTGICEPKTSSASDGLQ
jgi:hypothetical protein